MTELDDVIARAYASQGRQEEVNKVYLSLLRASLFLPVKKDPTLDGEPFSPLYTTVNEHYFILVFDTLERLTVWAGEQLEQMNYVELSGKDLIAGLGKQVFLGLNMGSEFYKEFSPEEVQHLKKIVARIEQMKQS